MRKPYCYKTLWEKCTSPYANPDEKTNTMDVRLPNKFGNLSIQTTPSGLPVFLNNKRIGTSPITEEVVPPGEYELEIRSKRFRSSKLQVKVKAGDQKQLQIVAVPTVSQQKKPKYDDFFELDVSKSKRKKTRDPSFDLEP